MGRSSDSRERLIEAAMGLLWRHGFASVSVDQLCAAANVKKGSFYHFFESKEELALAAMEAHWAQRKPVLDEAFSPSLPPLERLERYFDYILSRQKELQAETGNVLGCFYFSLGNACLEHPRLSARLREIIGTYERYYESVLSEAQRAGVIDVANPAEKARGLFRYIEGTLADARIRNSTETLEQLPRLAFEFLGIERSEKA